MIIEVVFIDGSKIQFDHITDVRLMEECNTAVITIKDAIIPTLININMIKYLKEMI